MLLSLTQQFEAIPERLRQRHGQGGLGYLLLLANGNMDTALLFAGIVALTVLGIVLFALIGLVERLMLPPHAAEHASLVHETM